LAHYRLDNDELDEARNYLTRQLEERREIGDYENYLIESWLGIAC